MCDCDCEMWERKTKQETREVWAMSGVLKCERVLILYIKETKCQRQLNVWGVNCEWSHEIWESLDSLYQRDKVSKTIE